MPSMLMKKVLMMTILKRMGDLLRKREAPVLLLYPATRPYVRASKRCVIVVPKGKIYPQLVLDSIPGVVARCGI